MLSYVTVEVQTEDEVRSDSIEANPKVVTVCGK